MGVPMSKQLQVVSPKIRVWPPHPKGTCLKATATMTFFGAQPHANLALFSLRIKPDTLQTVANIELIDLLLQLLQPPPRNATLFFKEQECLWIAPLVRGGIQFSLFVSSLDWPSPLPPWQLCQSSQRNLEGPTSWSCSLRCYWFWGHINTWRAFPFTLPFFPSFTFTCFLQTVPIATLFLMVPRSVLQGLWTPVFWKFQNGPLQPSQILFVLVQDSLLVTG